MGSRWSEADRAATVDRYVRMGHGRDVAIRVYITPEAYMRGNLVGREVLASDVAAAFVHLAKARTSTGAVLTVDGGNVAAMMR